MNAKDRKRLIAILANANALLNAGDQGNGIRDIDVIEALIADVSAALGNADPIETQLLVARDVRCDCGKGSNYLYHFKGCAVLIANFKARTADGVEITHGLPVWDYDLRPGYVNLKRLGDDNWFEVSGDGVSRGSLMNAERVCVRHPRTGQKPDALLKQCKRGIHEFDTEVRLSDCPKGCKVMRCRYCTESIVAHSTTYGCVGTFEKVN